MKCLSVLPNIFQYADYTRALKSKVSKITKFISQCYRGCRTHWYDFQLTFCVVAQQTKLFLGSPTRADRHKLILKNTAWELWKAANWLFEAMECHVLSKYKLIKFAAENESLRRTFIVELQPQNLHWIKPITSRRVIRFWDLIFLMNIIHICKIHNIKSKWKLIIEKRACIE